MLTDIRGQLDWHGPTGRPQGHIVLTQMSAKIAPDALIEALSWRRRGSHGRAGVAMLQRTANGCPLGCTRLKSAPPQFNAATAAGGAMSVGEVQAGLMLALSIFASMSRCTPAGAESQNFVCQQYQKLDPTSGASRDLQ